MFDIDEPRDPRAQGTLPGLADAHPVTPVASTEIDARTGLDALDAVDGLGVDAALAVAAQLQATADRAEAGFLRVAAHYADLHPDPPETDDGADCAGGVRGARILLLGLERGVVLGGQGCPMVAEFAAVELGAALGISSGAAAGLMEDASELRHRLPLVWARMLAGEVQAWRARKIAQATQTLTQKAAGLVDRRVARIAQSVTPGRLARIVQAAILDADPAQAAADAAAVAAERGCGRRVAICMGRGRWW